jgi:maltose alpha-D-glucosyltransferase/alpha-amylase
MDANGDGVGDFVEFTHGCKQPGMRLLIEPALKHTPDEHVWFQQARSDPKATFSGTRC